MTSITSLSYVPPVYTQQKASGVRPLLTKIQEIVARCFFSNSFQLLMMLGGLAGSVTLLALCSAPTVILTASLITCTALIALGSYFVVNRKKIVYELTLFATLVLGVFKINPWWHSISPGIYLGAIPLKNYAHHEKITKQLGVKAVLSMLEDFEFNTPGVFSVPCATADWDLLGVKHHVISATDFHAVPLLSIEQGVAFLEEQHRLGVDCYVHCKAGASRSATIVLAYLLKKGVVSSVAEGIKYLKKQRPLIFIPQDAQKNLEIFFQKYQSKHE